MDTVRLSVLGWRANLPRPPFQGGAGFRRRETRPPAAARRDRPRDYPVVEPGRNRYHPVYGRGIRSLFGGSDGAARGRGGTQALLLPAGGEERPPSRNGW